MIKRELYMERIRPFIGGELIKVLTGVRRSGKSVMLELIQQELIEKGISSTQLISFNFESMLNLKFCNASALYNEITKRISEIEGKAYLFFDEIQEVDGWEKCVNSCRVDFDCDIYITGSNASLLSGELATYLGGRYVEFTIYPFSFSEYLASRTDSNDLNAEFKRYLTLGGMPFLANLQYERAASLQYLSDIYNSIVLKDVIKRNNIRNVDLLERIISYVMTNIGHTFSARSISNYFKGENRNVVPETVLNYLKACCDAYLFHKVNRQEYSSKKLLSVNEKYYIIDLGIREVLFGSNQQNIDQVLENVVYLELLRRGYAVVVGKLGEKEIDFIAVRGKEKIYIQVSYLLASTETIAREFDVLLQIKDNYPKYVISMDEVDMSRSGIKHLNIKDFLLKKDLA